MVERRDSPKTTTCGRGLGRRLWVSYLLTGAALATLRVALLVWVNYEQNCYREPVVPFSMVQLFALGVYPELQVFDYVSIPHTSSAGMSYYLIGGGALTLGSFVLATPVLLLGWLKGNRR